MGISVWQLLIIAVIVVLLFGTKRLRNVGGDLGAALKDFKKEIKSDDAEFSKESDKPEQTKQLNEQADTNTDQVKPQAKEKQ